jgi:methylenetetrahydrofolate reductase (NADPH)
MWFQFCQRAEQQGCLDSLLEINAPINARRPGHEPLAGDSHKTGQPDWWQGDNQYHPPAYTGPVSKLEAMLRADQFPISAEVDPPMDFTGERIGQVVKCLKSCVATANFTDNPRGVARMSGLACALHSLEHGLEPVLQLQTQHRGRYDIEAEAVGAAVVGVRNILCLTDDIGRLGPGPRPLPKIQDLDAVQALWMLRRLRDEGINVDGETVEDRPRYFLGAMASPFSAIPRYEAIVTEKKINAGAQFLQTLPIFDLARFDEWLAALDKRNLLGKAYLMATVACLKSPRHARFMANDVPGVHIPNAIMARMENAADSGEEGVKIALDLLTQLKLRPGIHGLHILAPGEEQVVPRLIKGLNFRLVATVPHTTLNATNGHKKPGGHDVPNSHNLFGTEPNCQRNA